MWEELVIERGGFVLETSGVANGATVAPFVCLLVAGEEMLPLVARIDDGSQPAFLLKSGRVGGAEGAAGALPITEGDAAAALEAALSGEARWEADPDLGIELLVSGADGVAEELLIPRFLYRRADRIYEYAAAMPALVERMPQLLAPARAG